MKEIFKKRFLNQYRALELTFINGKSIFLDFYENNSKEFVDKIMKHRNKCVNMIHNKVLDPKSKELYEAVQKKWHSYEITNF